MRCEDCRELLFRYHENELQPEIAAETKEHLSGCKECANELAYIKKYKKQMSSLKQMEAPSDFAAAVNRKIHENSTRGKILNALFNPLKIKLPVEAAGLAAVCFLVIIIINHIPRQKQAILTKSMIMTQKDESMLDKESFSSQRGSVAMSPAEKIAVDTKVKKAISSDSLKEKTVTYQIAFLFKEQYATVNIQSETPYPASKSVRAESAAGASDDYVMEERKAKRAAAPEMESKLSEESEPQNELLEVEKRDQLQSSDFKKLNAIILKNKGIIRRINDKTTGMESFNIEIPESSEKQFLEDLKNIGEIKDKPAFGNDKENRIIIEVMK